VQRRHHYEQALEHYLRQARLPYVSVNEARKALLPAPRLSPAATSPTSPSPAALKSFDLVLYGPSLNLLAEVKGRRAARRLECWVTEDDIASLRAWETLFGPGFRAAFLFVYWCEEQPPAPLFEEIFAFQQRWYAVRTVLVADYARAMRPRSPRWRTVDLPAPAFDRLSRPFTARSLDEPWETPAPPSSALLASA
jgi:hypothetical protein